MPSDGPSSPRRPTGGPSSRAPFDPTLLPDLTADSPPEAGGDASGAVGGAWTVSQLASRIAAALAQGLPAQIRVVGEVSGFSDRTHWWFSLKDDAAVVGCAMFAPQARRCSFTPANGQQVVATGRVDHYAKAGKTQLYVEALEPVGLGPLELAFRRLFEALKSKGYFDAARKKPLPRFPRRIAIVTSRTGAALQDALDTLRRRAPMIEVAVVDVRVQGDEAASEIARAIEALSKQRKALGLEALILTRGGGSMEDLWAFNEGVVAEALFRCELPVVAAIGHETDVTIAELVADERAATPTQAAMRIAPDREALAEQTAALSSRLSAGARRRLALEGERLRGAARLPIFANPRALLRAPAERTSAGAQRLQAAAGRRLAVSRDRVKAIGEHLDAVSPLAVLARGYSVTTTEAGAIVASVQDVRAGARIATRVRDGSFESIVAADGSPPSAPPATSRAKRPRAGPPRAAPPEEGLFG